MMVYLIKTLLSTICFDELKIDRPPFIFGNNNND